MAGSSSRPIRAYKPGRRPRSFSGADETNVTGALPSASRVILDVELDLLAFLKGIELTRGKRGMVKEDLAAIFGTDEAEPTIPDEADDWTACHDVSLLCGHCLSVPAQELLAVQRSYYL
jgi:hypothetical protein